MAGSLEFPFCRLLPRAYNRRSARRRWPNQESAPCRRTGGQEDRRTGAPCSVTGCQEAPCQGRSLGRGRWPQTGMTGRWGRPLRHRQCKHARAQRPGTTSSMLPPRRTVIRLWLIWLLWLIQRGRSLQLQQRSNERVLCRNTCGLSQAMIRLWMTRCSRVRRKTASQWRSDGRNV
jgi:hypothetical protein